MKATYKIQIPFIIVFILLLACVRAFEMNLFYDPFILFFKEDFHNLPFPKYDTTKLFLSLSFRYFLNSVISLGIIYAVFLNFNFVKFSFLLFIFIYILLISFLFGVLCFFKDQNTFMIFYLRRFLIQPIFVILFIPAFYYQKNKR
ncbi:MAG: exosortase F system-associated membrane protein [Flavobacterium sp.]